MKNRLFKIMKNTITGITLGAMVLGTAVMIPVGAEAATDDGTKESITDTVHFVPYSYAEFEKYVTKSAPEYEGNKNASYGYIFGGWYKDESETHAITSEADAEELETVYAKFVPSYVMGVKCQNHLSAEEDDTMKIRVVSSIDSTRYKEVGMIVDKITLDENGNFSSSQKVYDNSVSAYNGQLNVYSSTTEYVQYDPKEVFGTEAEYFTAANLSGISDYDMIICVQPYWITKDDVKVVGLSRYIRVNDGRDSYVSIPVNLNSATKVAAGILSVNFENMTKAGYKLASVEGGTVFSEMEYNISGDTVKCVGNVSTLADVDSNDIFMNLRFEVPENAESRIYSEEAFYHLTVSEEDFTNVDEDPLTYDVWNIQY